MAEIAAEVLIALLAEWGVDTVFGLPGDGINGIMEGLRRHQDKVRFVLVHHEQAAAFMAAADAKPWPSVGPARTPATAPTFIGARSVPDAASLERAARVLNEGTRVA